MRASYNKEVGVRLYRQRDRGRTAVNTEKPVTSGNYLPFKGSKKANARPADDAAADYNFGVQRDLSCRPQSYRDGYLRAWEELDSFMNTEEMWDE